MLTENKELTKLQRLMRAELLLRADLDAASALANKLGTELLQRFNEASEVGIDGIRSTAGTSIVARVLLARAMLMIASAWWADLMPSAKVPDAKAALLSIMLDLPAGMDMSILHEDDT